MNAPTKPEALQPGTFEYLDLTRIIVSNTQMQKDRRASLDKEGIRKLTENVAAVGVIQPVLVRPAKGDKFELVAGERRFIASTNAKLKTIPAVIKQLTDLEVAELQVIENIQRENLHELIEAEGYEELVKVHKYTKEQIAAKIGKSKEYVYGRLKLCDLSPACRKAFLDDKISASIALSVARIEVHEHQDEAVKEIIRRDLSFRDAKAFLQENYMLLLGKAPFPVDDAKLVPKAGACSTCPKKTGNQPELFADVKNKDLCTDAKCFQEKTEAQVVVVRKQYEEKGIKFFGGAEAKKVWPQRWGGLTGGYIKLDEHEYFNGNYKTWREALGKAAEQNMAVIENPWSDNGDKRLVQIIKRDTAAQLLADKGVTVGHRSSGGGGNPDRARERKARLETAVNQSIFDAIRAKPIKIGRDELVMIADAHWNRLHYDAQKPLMALYQWEDRGGGGSSKQIEQMDDSQLARFLLDVTLAPDIKVGTYGGNDNSNLLAIAKKLNIDTAALRKPLVDAQKERDKKRQAREAKKKANAKKKPKPAKAAGKKKEAK